MATVLCPKLFGQATPDGQAKQATPPHYQTLRQDEDWSALANCDASASPDFFDPLKYVRLSKGGTVWASLGGEIRERVESWNQFNFGAPATAIHNDGFLLSRLLLNADLHLGEHLRVFAQEKSAFETHRALLGGRRTSDEDDLDLQNGFVDLAFPVSDSANFTVRAGRQELLFGKQRLVGPSDWLNTRRTFDGFSGILNFGKWKVTGFWTRPVLVLKYDYNPSDSATEFYGIHSTGRLPGVLDGLDLYWYDLRRKTATYNGSSGNEFRHTLGGHAYGPVLKTGFDYDLGGAYQFGEVGTHDISAFMLITELGYSFRQFRTSPRLYIGFDYASGSHTADGEVGTYNQLFPSGHVTLGYMDIVGRQNIVDLGAGASAKLVGKLTVALAEHNFWLADVHDALYDKRGAVVRPAAPGGPSRVGSEADLTLRYALDRHTQAETGGGHFFPGEFLRQAGPHRPEDFGYLMLQYTF